MNPIQFFRERRERRQERERQRKLAELRQAYREGRVSPESYMNQALVLKDGDDTRKEIMRRLRMVTGTSEGEEEQL